MPDHQTHEPAHKEEGSLEDLILSALPSRRKALWFLGASALSSSALAACGGGGSTTISTSASSSSSSSSASASSSSSSSSSSSASGTCTELPEETEGPYPGDGSNSANGSIVNVLNLSGIVRSDIRSSVGSYSGTASGIPLTLKIRLVNTSLGCQPLSGYALYIWNCTSDGKYSLYGVTNQNYLRGVQETDADGYATFVTIVPACYNGRVPHIHIEVYPGLSTATTYANKIQTTQFTFDRDFSETFYASASGYSASISNLARVSFANDLVFGDDTAAQLAASTLTPTGSISAGYTASIDLGVAI